MMNRQMVVRVGNKEELYAEVVKIIRKGRKRKGRKRKGLTADEILDELKRNGIVEEVSERLALELEQNGLAIRMKELI